MDDYTWKKRLEARRNQRKRERYLAIFFLIAMVFGFFMYIGVYTKTPDYAMQTAQEALIERDSDKFNRYVDLVSLTSRAYDDLTADIFKYDTKLSERERSLFENFYVLIRPQIAQGAVEVIDYKINNNLWILPSGILQGRQLGIDFDLLLERSMLRHTTILGVGKVEYTDVDKAIVNLDVVEDYTKTNFTLQLEVEKVNGAGWSIGGFEFDLLNRKWKVGTLNINLGTSDWRVVGVNNYKDYLDKVTPILRQELADYIDITQEIVDRYNDAFRIQRNEFIYMQRTQSGEMSSQQKERIASYIENNVIPNLQNRQQELDSIDVPNGALYLSKLRRETTNISVSAWSYYIKGLREGSVESFHTAESLHKQELAIDQRIEEIVHDSAISRERPDVIN